jgi:hypothetical protein
MFDPDLAASRFPPTPLKCSNSPPVNSDTRPFTDVVPLPNGSCSTTVVQSADGSLQAGIGNLINFDMVVTGTMTVHSAGKVPFEVYVDDGFALGFGRSSGGRQPSGTGPESVSLTKTFSRGYRIAGGGWFPTTPNRGVPFSVTFPAAGTYPFELDYEETFDAELQMVLEANGKPLVGKTASNKPASQPNIELAPAAGPVNTPVTVRATVLGTTGRSRCTSISTRSG